MITRVMLHGMLPNGMRGRHGQSEQGVQIPVLQWSPLQWSPLREYFPRLSCAGGAELVVMCATRSGGSTMH
jgi:hypothetical protein